jgi:hypothetical protein
MRFTPATTLLLASVVLPTDLARALTIGTSQPYLGVTQYRYVYDGTDASIPRPVVVNVLAIDVTAPGIRFLMQPGNGSLPGEVTRSTTADFVDSVNAQMGINVGFYDTNPPYTPQNGQYFTDVTYISASNGNVYSTANGKEALFNISASNVPSILNAAGAGSSTAGNGTVLYNASGGNLKILSGGALVNTTGGYATTLNPHTAFGVSKDQKTVYLAAVDGRESSSQGMYTYELAQLMAGLGAWNAVNLDGGGSTTMVMDDSNDREQNVRVINTPSDGNERLVANSLAVYANFNPNYVPLNNLPQPGQTGVVPNLAAATFLDRYEGSLGHFATGALGSGSNRNVAASSSVTLDPSKHIEGNSSMKVTINSTNGATAQMQLRLLSGGGTQSNNLTNGMAMGSAGYVGVWLQLPVGSAPLYASILLDDGTKNSAGLEYASFKQLPADGQWHLYEWPLFYPALWTSFAGGDGAIGGPDVFVDSLFFSSTNAISGGTNWSGTVWVDGLSYNPYGSVAAMVPEPLAVSLLTAVPILFGRRQRRG